MKRVLWSVLGLAFFGPLAFAAGKTVNVTWTAPTEYDDNSTLAAADIAFYTVNACEKTAPAKCIQAKVLAPATAAPGLVLDCGDYNIWVTVTTSATARFPNLSSGPSTSVPYATGVSCAPNPPSGVAVAPVTG